MSFLDKMFSGAALALRSRTSDVDVSESDEPLPGDVLTAVDRATARWLPPPTGGGGGSVDAVARAAAAAAQSTADHADSAAAAAQSTANAAQGIALSASSDAAAAQSTANTANTAAATAQSTASAASSAASAAQSTASTALTNAATAQTTANTANTAAGAAQSTASAAVPKALYDPNTVLVATADNTPFALTMPPSTMLARLASGDIIAATVAQINALLTFSVAADINPFHWYRGDNTLSTAGLVDTIVDAGTGAKNFVQTGAARCPVGTDSNGRIYIAPDGAVDFYQAGVQADWKFLNDGSPWTVMMVIHRTALLTAQEMLIDTTDSTTAATGAFVALGFTSASVQGPLAAITASAAGSFTLQVRSYIPNTSLQVIVVRHVGYGTDVTAGARAQPVDMQLRRQGALVSTCGTQSATSSPPYANTNPTYTLTLFKRATTAGQFFAGRLYDLIIHNGALSDRQVLGYENYARAQYGVAI